MQQYYIHKAEQPMYAQQMYTGYEEPQVVSQKRNNGLKNYYGTDKYKTGSTMHDVQAQGGFVQEPPRAAGVDSSPDVESQNDHVEPLQQESFERRKFKK